MFILIVTIVCCRLRVSGSFIDKLYRYIVLIIIVTICYIVVTVFEYRYNCSEYDSSWDNCKDMGNGSKWDLHMNVNGVYWYSK